MNREIPTRRTLIIRKPDLNNFERYKIDPTPVYENIKKMPAFHQFMSHNPLPYYMGDPHTLEGGGFWEQFAEGFKKGFTTTLDIGSHLLPLVGLGHDVGTRASNTYGENEMEGCGKKKAKRGGKKKAMKKESESEESASEAEELEHEMEHVKHEERENKRLDTIEKNVKEMKKANKKILRGEMVRDLMKNRGMKLGEASRYIKEHKLI